MKDHIPNWAGGRRGLHLDTGIERLRTILADAEATGLSVDLDASYQITLKQARELWAKLREVAGA